VWHIGCQDVVAIGHLFRTGQLLLERIISLAGPQVKNPRLLKTRMGACLSEIIASDLEDGDNRVISGSVLSGRRAGGPVDYLGRYHNQISVLAENREQKLFGWLTPGMEQFSIKAMFVSALFKNKLFPFTTALNGGRRPIVPTGAFEQVMPLDIEATYLLRALAIKDTDQAQALGCLELDEEDLALLTFVDSSKNEFGPMLRENLNLIEKEG